MTIPFYKRLNWHWFIALVAIVIFTIVSKSLYHMAHTLDITQMKSVILATPPLTMLKAIVVVIMAYILLSVYDLIAVRYLNTKIPYPKVLNTSLTAFSIGHTLGVSMLSAGAVRFRYYGKYGIENAQIANIILLVSLASGQTADIAFTSKAGRKLATLHSIIAFVFNLLIISLLINIVASYL